MATHDNRDIAEQAAEWIVRLDDPQAGTGERRAFVAWLKRSPVHLAEYLLAERAWAELGQLDPDRRIDVAALLAQPETNVVGLEGLVDRARPRRASRLPLAMTAAAALAVFASYALLQWRGSVEPVYATALGEQRTLRLDDGSSVVLNTDTRLRVAYTDTARTVELLEGEALFSVQRDRLRPFRVTSDRVVVQAVGTAFVVRMGGDLTAVTVLQGEVAVIRPEQVAPDAGAGVPVQALRARAGERVDVVAHAVQARSLANPEAAAAWRGGRLVFDGQTLAEAVAEFNRYNRTKLVLDDPVLSAERVSGVFDVDRPQALASFLDHAGVVETPSLEGDRIVLTPRR